MALALEIAATLGMSAVTVYLNGFASALTGCTTVFAARLRRASATRVFTFGLFVVVCHREPPDYLLILGRID